MVLFSSIWIRKTNTIHQVPELGMRDQEPIDILGEDRRDKDARVLYTYLCNLFPASLS